jgi:anti-anti-sigma factor
MNVAKTGRAGTGRDRLQVDTHTFEDGGEAWGGQVTVVSLRGEADIDSAPLLRRTLAFFMDGDRVVLDLRGLTFLDSSGLALLVMLSRRLDEDGLTLGLASNATDNYHSGHIEGLLASAGLATRHRVLRLVDEVDAAGIAAQVNKRAAD